MERIEQLSCQVVIDPIFVADHAEVMTYTKQRLTEQIRRHAEDHNMIAWAESVTFEEIDLDPLNPSHPTEYPHGCKLIRATAYVMKRPGS